MTHFDKKLRKLYFTFANVREAEQFIYDTKEVKFDKKNVWRQFTELEKNFASLEKFIS